jgi:hypothetical protein
MHVWVSLHHPARVLTWVKNGRSDCRFAESKEESLGQAAEVDLLDRLLVREGARFPVNEPPVGEWEKANSAWQWD